MLEILWSWLTPVRHIGLWLDKIAFSLIDDAYDLIYMFASGELFSNDTIQKITRNLYIVIGIFALFRIALLLVNAIINPDKLSEKGNGISRVLVNFLLVFVFLVATPIVFDEAFKIQSEIMGGNYIERLFVKIDYEKNPDGTYKLNGDGNKIPLRQNPGQTMRNIAIESLITLEKGTTKDDKGIEPSDNCTGECANAVNQYIQMKEKKNFSFDILGNYIGVTMKKDGGEVYVYNYMFLVTTAVGAFLTYVLISFAIDIAVRVVELSALEILAPLFIVTYIDPKSGKSGPFHKWLIAVGKTYASLFIKIAIISLMLLFISSLTQGDGTAKAFYGDLPSLGKLLLLFAILIFAKKAPKWIGDMIGVSADSSGLGGLGIGKKLGGAALVGGAVGKGIASAKKHAGQEAKKMGYGMTNRVGSYLGGSIAGYSAARNNALGDKSYRYIKDNEGKMKAAKSFFNKEDREARRASLDAARVKGNLKTGAKQGILDAKVKGTQMALDGKFVSGVALGRGIKQAYDPGFMSHNQRKMSKLENKANDYSGFDMSKINTVKDSMKNARLATLMTGVKHIANGEKIINVNTGEETTIFNSKTLKKEYGASGSTISSWEDMAALNIGGKDPANDNKYRPTYILPNDIKRSDGTIEFAAGSAVLKDVNGKINLVASPEQVTAEVKRLKSGYTFYGQNEMDAVFAERKAENASAYIQTQQYIGQTQQNIAKLSLDLAPLETQFDKLKKIGVEMADKLDSLKAEKQRETTDFSRQAELTKEIDNLTKQIETNMLEQRNINDKIMPIANYKTSQEKLLRNYETESLRYNNPDNPITAKINGEIQTLNLANATEIQTILNNDKEKLKKIAKDNRPDVSASDNKKGE